MLIRSGAAWGRMSGRIHFPSSMASTYSGQALVSSVLVSERSSRLKEVVLLFTRLGFTAFGGVVWAFTCFSRAA